MPNYEQQMEILTDLAFRRMDVSAQAVIDYVIARHDSVDRLRNNMSVTVPLDVFNLLEKDMGGISMYLVDMEQLMQDYPEAEDNKDFITVYLTLTGMRIGMMIAQLMLEGVTERANA